MVLLRSVLAEEVWKMSVGWKRTYTDEHIKTFVSMWHNGHTAPEIAKALNKSMILRNVRQDAMFLVIRLTNYGMV